MDDDSGYPFFFEETLKLHLLCFFFPIFRVPTRFFGIFAPLLTEAIQLDVDEENLPALRLFFGDRWRFP
jgi:hypothetical protein